jgi:hypothetical protein
MSSFILGYKNRSYQSQREFGFYNDIIFSCCNPDDFIAPGLYKANSFLVDKKAFLYKLVNASPVLPISTLSPLSPF